MAASSLLLFPAMYDPAAALEYPSDFFALFWKRHMGGAGAVWSLDVRSATSGLAAEWFPPLVNVAVGGSSPEAPEDNCSSKLSARACTPWWSMADAADDSDDSDDDSSSSSSSPLAVVGPSSASSSAAEAAGERPSMASARARIAAWSNNDLLDPSRFESVSDMLSSSLDAMSPSTNIALLAALCLALGLGANSVPRVDSSEARREAAAGSSGGAATVRGAPAMWSNELSVPSRLESISDMLSSSLDAASPSITMALMGELCSTLGLGANSAPLGDGAEATEIGDAAGALDGEATVRGALTFESVSDMLPSSLDAASPSTTTALLGALCLTP